MLLPHTERQRERESVCVCVMLCWWHSANNKKENKATLRSWDHHVFCVFESERVVTNHVYNFVKAFLYASWTFYFAHMQCYTRINKLLIYTLMLNNIMKNASQSWTLIRTYTIYGQLLLAHATTTKHHLDIKQYHINV